MDDIDWSRAPNFRDMNRAEPVRREPKIDTGVSHVLGRPVLTTDPRLIRLVVEFKNKMGTSPDGEKMDYFLKNPEFIKELKKRFA